MSNVTSKELETLKQLGVNITPELIIAALQAQSAELVAALEEYIADHTDTAKKYLTGNPEQCNCSTCFKARLALDKVKGE